MQEVRIKEEVYEEIEKPASEMTSHELARKLLEGLNLRIIIPKLSAGKEAKNESVTYGGKGIPTVYDLSEEYKEMRDKLAKEYPYEEIVFLL